MSGKAPNWHYNDKGNPVRNDGMPSQWIIFDPVLEDDAVRELIGGAVDIRSIERQDNGGVVRLWATYDDAMAAQVVLRTAAASKQEMRRFQQREESKAKFEAYYASLDLNGEIEIPAVITQRGKPKEAGVFIRKLGRRNKPEPTSPDREPGSDGQA